MHLSRRMRAGSNLSTPGVKGMGRKGQGNGKEKDKKENGGAKGSVQTDDSNLLVSAGTVASGGTTRPSAGSRRKNSLENPG